MTAYAMVIVVEMSEAPMAAWEFVSEELGRVGEVTFVGDPWRVITEDEYDTARLVTQLPPELRRVR